MQTRFSAGQLVDPGVRAAEGIIRRCVHCGFCNATCPTFLLHGDELEGPRGRIYLIKDMLESDCAPGAEVVRHIDSCLSCLSCMSTCPSGVNYMHLVDIGRARVETLHRRPLAERLLRRALAAVLSSPRLSALAVFAGRTAARLRLPAPARLRPALELLRRTRPAAAAPLRDFYSGAEPRRGRVALLAGCVQQSLGNEINQASVRLLNRLGFDVDVLADDCCGALRQHLGLNGAALKDARRNVRAWMRRRGDRPADAILTNASGCGTQLKDYRYLLRDDPALREPAAEFSGMVRDIGEFLSGLPVPDLPGLAGRGLPVACSVPCSLRHGQRLADRYPGLLRRYGYAVKVPEDDHLCCGSAGTYNLLQPDNAEKLAARKTANIAATGAVVMAGGNLGCIIQLAPRLSIPATHAVQLLDWASGGPRPPGLDRLET